MARKTTTSATETIVTDVWPGGPTGTDGAPAPEAISGNGAAEPVSPGDVFDRLATFRLRQTFDKIKVRRPLTTVGIRKPKRHEWFQAHPEHRYEGVLFEAQEEGLNPEWYFPTNEEVLAALEELSVKGVKNVAIFWWVNRKKHTFIWPVTLADSDGRQLDWHASMFEMMTVHACGQWCRIEAADAGYDPTIADPEEGQEVPAPEWPLVENFGQVLRVAFKKGGRVIDTLDHNLIKRLRG
jgi:hypothetical protein